LAELLIIKFKTFTISHKYRYLGHNCAELFDFYGPMNSMYKHRMINLTKADFAIFTW